MLLNMKAAGVTPGRELYVTITQKLPGGMLMRFVVAMSNR